MPLSQLCRGARRTGRRCISITRESTQAPLPCYCKVPPRRVLSFLQREALPSRHVGGLGQPASQEPGLKTAGRTAWYSMNAHGGTAVALGYPSPRCCTRFHLCRAEVKVHAREIRGLGGS